MKKIVIFSAGLASGGAEHQCSILLNFLVESGYDVTYTSFYDVEDHYVVDKRIKRVHLAPHKSSYRKLLSIIIYFATLKTDVVFAFSQRLSVLSLIPSIIFFKKTKIISCERNCTILSPDIWEKIIYKLKLYKRSDYVVPNSVSQGKYLLQKMPYLENKIKVICNYTDINQFKPTPLPLNKVIRIGIFCRFEAQKNVLNFIEAINKLKTSGYNNFVIEWYGNHSFNTEQQTDYFFKCEYLIKKYNLTEYIHIFDPIKNVSEMIPSFDVMCLPSLFEGFSNSISEYICCARPVLCSDVSDNSSMVHDGQNGFLFNPKNIDEITSAFIKYFNLTNAQKEQFGKESRIIAESIFNKDKFISSYMDIIEN